MMRRQLFGGILAAAAIAFHALPAQSAFHLWSISELYSNSDGSVQFVELFTNSSFQNSTLNTQITTGTHTFTFPSALPGDTANKHLLLATTGFGSLPGGVTPDFTIPSNFFNPAGDNVHYVGTFTTDGNVTFSSAPTNGVASLNYPGGVSGTNSPKNYAGNSGSVNLTPPPTPTGDYNGNGKVDAADYVLWRKTLGQSVSNGTAADGSGNGTIDNADYTFWASKFGTVLAGSAAEVSQAGAVPEPATLAMIAAGFLVLCYRRHTSAS